MADLADLGEARIHEPDEDGCYGGYDDEPDVSHFEDLEVGLERLASQICDEFELPEDVIGADLDEVIVTVASRAGRLTGSLVAFVEYIAVLLDFLRSQSYGERYTGDPPGWSDWEPLKQLIRSFGESEG